MTVLIEARNTEPTVDSVMGQILNELGGSVGLLLSALGLRTGLWEALAESGPLTPPELSERTGVAAPLAGEWLRAQAAAGYLRYDPGSERFALPEAVAVAMLNAPGGAMIDACTSMLCSMGAGFAEFSDAFRGNGGYGWVRRSEEYLNGSDLLTRAALPPDLIGAMLDQVATNLATGGSIADACCGYGSPTLALAAHFPSARVLGIDYSDVSVAHARSSAAGAGVGERVRFEVAAATDLPGSGYDLITFFDALHDLGDPVGALVVAREALAPDGVVLLVEPIAGDRVEDNLNPAGRMFYSISTLVCTPNALSQQGPGAREPLGTQAGEARLREVATTAGFGRVRRVAVEAPLNLVLELRP
jgi:SAM-dependent methyltransferase